MRSLFFRALAVAAVVGCADDPLPAPARPAQPPPAPAPAQLTIVNGDPGIDGLRIVVDGRAQEVTGLRPNEVRALARSATPAR